MQAQTLSRMYICLFCFVSAGIHAEEDQKVDKATEPEKKVSSVPLDTKYSWNGDIIKFHANFSDVKVGDKTVCAPSKSEFVVSNDDKATHKLTGVFIDLGKHKTGCSGETVESDTKYLLEKAEVELAPHSRRGWTFGALALPFKYQFYDKTFTNATTIGPYLGYGITSNWGDMMGGTSTTVVFSAGWVNNIDVPLLKATDGKESNGKESNGSVNRSGFTAAVGLVFSVDKGTGMQFGIFAGQDRLGRNALAPYKYEGKWWLSGMVGYKFF